MGSESTRFGLKPSYDCYAWVHAGGRRDNKKERGTVEWPMGGGPRYVGAVGRGSRWPTRSMVLDARYACWSREAALTSLVARCDVSPFGKLLSFLALPRLRPLGLDYGS
jgi:hypothetical protein